MSTSTAQGSSAALTRRVGGWFVRHARGFAALTLVTTFLLVLLGEFTAAAGAGATCNQTYPGCAGHLSPVGLSVPQFVEWFHRLVAMSVGFLILGNAVIAWWIHRGTRVSRSAWLAAVLLPLQVVLGGTTVTFEGLVPGGYSPPVQLSHFTVAVAIFTALLAAYVWLDAAEGRGATRRRLGLVATVGLALPVLQAVFARGFLLVFWPSVQTAYHLFGLAGFAAFVALALWARDVGDTDLALLGGLGALVTVLNAYLIVGLFVVTARVEAVAGLLLAFQFALFAVAVWRARRTASGPAIGRASSG